MSLLKSLSFSFCGNKSFLSAPMRFLPNLHLSRVRRRKNMHCACVGSQLSEFSKTFDLTNLFVCGPARGEVKKMSRV